MNVSICGTYFPFVTFKLMNVQEVGDMLSVCTPLKLRTTLTDLKNVRQLQSTLFRSWLSSYFDFMILLF